MSAIAQPSPAFARRVARWWRNWTSCDAAVPDESRRVRDVERSAHLTEGNVRTLAGKWPDSAEVLSRRLLPTLKKSRS